MENYFALTNGTNARILKASSPTGYKIEKYLKKGFRLIRYVGDDRFLDAVNRILEHLELPYISPGSRKIVYTGRCLHHLFPSNPKKVIIDGEEYATGVSVSHSNFIGKDYIHHNLRIGSRDAYQVVYQGDAYCPAQIHIIRDWQNPDIVFEKDVESLLNMLRWEEVTIPALKVLRPEVV